MFPLSLKMIDLAETYAPEFRRHYVVEQKQANGRYLEIAAFSSHLHAVRYCNTLHLFQPVDYRIAEVLGNKSRDTWRHNVCTWPTVYFPNGGTLDRRVGGRLYYALD